MFDADSFSVHPLITPPVVVRRCLTSRLVLRHGLEKTGRMECELSLKHRYASSQTKKTQRNSCSPDRSKHAQIPPGDIRQMSGHALRNTHYAFFSNPGTHIFTNLSTHTHTHTPSFHFRFLKSSASLFFRLLFVLPVKSYGVILHNKNE